MGFLVEASDAARKRAAAKQALQATVLPTARPASHHADAAAKSAAALEEQRSLVFELTKVRREQVLKENPEGGDDLSKLAMMPAQERAMTG